MTTGTESRGQTPLLLLIFLALLVQPFALALILPGPDARPGPPQDSRLAAAIDDLAEAVLLGPANRTPATVDAPRDPGHVRRDAPVERAEVASPLAPIATPKDGENATPAAARVFPKNRERIEAWIRHERQRKARHGEDAPMLFFHRTTDELLATFGMPDNAYEQSNGVRWVYDSEDGDSQLMLDIHAGRVFRFWFNQ